MSPSMWKTWTPTNPKSTSISSVGTITLHQKTQLRKSGLLRVRKKLTNSQRRSCATKVISMTKRIPMPMREWLSWTTTRTFWPNLMRFSILISRHSEPTTKLSTTANSLRSSSTRFSTKNAKWEWRTRLPRWDKWGSKLRELSIPWLLMPWSKTRMLVQGPTSTSISKPNRPTFANQILKKLTRKKDDDDYVLDLFIIIYLYSY